jgi:hypothetical protein
MVLYFMIRVSCFQMLIDEAGLLPVPIKNIMNFFSEGRVTPIEVDIDGKVACDLPHAFRGTSLCGRGTGHLRDGLDEAVQDARPRPVVAQRNVQEPGDLCQVKWVVIRMLLVSLPSFLRARDIVPLHSYVLLILNWAEARP